MVSEARGHANALFDAATKKLLCTVLDVRNNYFVVYAIYEKKQSPTPQELEWLIQDCDIILFQRVMEDGSILYAN